MLEMFCYMMNNWLIIYYFPFNFQTGIDIDAGCGQLKSELMRRKKLIATTSSCVPSSTSSSSLIDEIKSNEVLVVDESQNESDSDVMLFNSGGVFNNNSISVDSTAHNM